jgi:hypothetical protein
MEIVKSRNNDDRVLTRINFEKIRVISEKSRFRIFKDRSSNEIKMFDFEGGPIFNVGGKVFFEKLHWKIQNIEILESDLPLNEVVLTVTPSYTNGK